METCQFSKNGSLYFLTFSVVQWLPVFISEEPCCILTDSLNYCHEKKGLRVHSYVIMPTHMHSILSHESLNGKKLGKTVTAFRKHTGRRMLEFCEGNTPACFLDIFQAVAGADRNAQFWQPKRHPEAIESQEFIEQKWNYVHDNPCRKGLVEGPEHWRFSSASYWASGAEKANDVVLTAIEF